jgi:hypothetical protein
MSQPREEAERLVAAALAALSMAASSTAGFATGSAECCVCPLCKAIAAARDPDPDLAERLATGAGNVAEGVASFLRVVGDQFKTTSAWHEATQKARAETSTTDSDVAQD